MSHDHPRLRRVDAFPVEQDGRRFLGLRDPAGYTEAVILVPAELLEIVARFDGRHSVADVQAAVRQARGERVRGEQIRELADALDAQGFLDSPAFAEGCADYAGQTERPYKPLHMRG